MPVDAGLEGSDYLEITRASLPAALDEVQPDLVVYNAGSEPYKGDPLANIG